MDKQENEQLKEEYFVKGEGVKKEFVITNGNIGLVRKNIKLMGIMRLQLLFERKQDRHIN